MLHIHRVFNAARLVALITIVLVLAWPASAKAGTQVPEFSLDTLDGTLRLSDLKGEIVILFFAFVG